MLLHEYQAKALLASHGIPVPRSKLVCSAGEAESAWKYLNCEAVVVKAQAHTGGRGKAGGIKIAKSAAEARDIAGQMIGSRLVTYQSGPDGKPVSKVLFEAPASAAKELYLACMVNRQSCLLSLIASTEGGVDIEEVSKKSPEKIHIVDIPHLYGLYDYKLRGLSARMGLADQARKQFVAVCKGLIKLYIGLDCSLVEINPLAILSDGSLSALDAKINIDDRALDRHPELKEMHDREQEDKYELQAKEAGLNYISLDGDIGCMVNGAGLAMATMDIIKYYGGSPANFLDVGGGAGKEQITTAFKILVSNKNVRAILINIFGGILKCDILAEGMVAAAKETNVSLPIVVRLEGTNVERGRRILESSGLKFATASSMAEAAQMVSGYVTKQ